MRRGRHEPLELFENRGDASLGAKAQAVTALMMMSGDRVCVGRICTRETEETAVRRVNAHEARFNTRVSLPAGE